MQTKTKKRILWSALSVALALLLLVGSLLAVCAAYLGDYYKPDRDAIAAFAPMAAVTEEKDADGNHVFRPDEPVAGFIFYPGGKVDAEAYAPLMAALAERGVLCVLVEMPFRLAVLDMNAAKGIKEQYPDIDRWYIGGHSLGGSMAASYLAKHKEEYEGLVLLGSYSTADLSESDLSVLSVYGSEDGVMNREKYEKNKINLPTDFTERVLDGGNHARFGMYGAQDGDGEASISASEQITATAAAILAMISE